MARREWSPEVREKVRQYYVKGWGVRQIARKLNVPASTVSLWIRKYGWDAERTAMEAVDAATKTLAVQEVPRDLAERVVQNWLDKGRAIDELIERINRLVSKLESQAEKPKELTRAIWALRQAVDALLQARAEERQFLKLAVDAKLAESGGQVVKFVVEVRNGG